MMRCEANKNILFRSTKQTPDANETEQLSSLRRNLPPTKPVHGHDYGHILWPVVDGIDICDDNEGGGEKPRAADTLEGSHDNKDLHGWG
ncbi:hypothetical protein BC936DRAFT_141494 [Jimgerdemannia flammicorona]|uniref:Uncharacterized protein n=1 Tax=Jimgerdemannia flammicorona TaxID=994334 RepID=A0A433A244_9FUNG|nr:hypothetical protein BC936DRAFT_141494 [Jimgerdemannia flammicorona]